MTDGSSRDAQSLWHVMNSQQVNDVGSELPRLCPIARARSFTPAAEHCQQV